MLATELVRQLVSQINEHGDHPIIISNGVDREVDGVEFNDHDDDPLFLLSGEEREED